MSDAVSQSPPVGALRMDSWRVERQINNTSGISGIAGETVRIVSVGADLINTVATVQADEDNDAFNPHAVYGVLLEPLSATDTYATVCLRGECFAWVERPTGGTGLTGAGEALIQGGTLTAQDYYLTNAKDQAVSATAGKIVCQKVLAYYIDNTAVTVSGGGELRKVSFNGLEGFGTNVTTTALS